MPVSKIIIGSRGSELALWQARFVQKLLQNECAIESEIKIIKTKGDQIQNIGFDKMEGKGFFTKEIEEALLKKEIDLAVHSFKDLETTQPDGLHIVAVSKREDPADVLLIRKECVDTAEVFDLTQYSRVGTSSSRRKSQMQFFRPDVIVEDLRGNVPTRIQKLREGIYDAILLAKAGVDRLALDITDLHAHVMDVTRFIPAPAQGVLALQSRIEDQSLTEQLQKIHHQDVAELINIERGILKAFGGGCQVPIGVYAAKKGTRIDLFISRAQTLEQAPLQWHLARESFDVEAIAEQFKKQKAASVFISTNPQDAPLFVKMLSDNAYTVHAQSLIETALLKNLPGSLPKADWVFFNSKKALQHFSEKYGHLFDKKIGVAGHGTKTLLEKLGYLAQFVATHENTKRSAEEFSTLVTSNETVLFPEASNTLATFQHYLEHVQVVSFPVYETRMILSILPAFDVYVFTSPSNVRSFYQKNMISPQAKVIAMGEKTKLELLHHQADLVVKLPQQLDFLSLAREVSHP